MPPTAVVTAASRDTRCRPAGRTVVDAMITDVKISGPDVTVGELRVLFHDEHVHAAVVVDRGVLLSVVERHDLEGVGCDDDLAAGLGTCQGRTVAPGVEQEVARRLLLRTGRRRLAVVGEDGALLGLLCLKRTRLGFCSDRDVRMRSRQHRGRQVA